MGRPAFEATVVQRAAAPLLGALDAQDVHECSSGFWAGRSPHQARHVWRQRGMKAPMGWMVDAAVSACLDRVEQDRLGEGLRQRVTEGAILCLLWTWLRAGVREGDTLRDPERGSPQGGVVAPRLATTVLEHVREAGVAREVTPRMKGSGLLLRCADASCRLKRTPARVGTARSPVSD